MNLYCRNPSCEHHSRIIDRARHPIKCPLCGWTLPDDANFEDSSILLPPALVPKSEEGGQAVPRLPGREHDGKPPTSPQPVPTPTPTPTSTPTPAPEPKPVPGFLPRWLQRKIEEDERGYDAHGVPSTYEAGRTVLPPSPFTAPSPNLSSLAPPSPIVPEGSSEEVIFVTSKRSKSKSRSKPSTSARSPQTPVSRDEAPPEIGKSTVRQEVASPAPGRKPKFVLEHVVDDRYDPIEFIDETRETPLFANEGRGRRQLATLKVTPQGVQLTPRESLNGVSIRIKLPVRLRTGRRVRIGNYVFEARLNEPPHFVESRIELGERFFAKELVPRGELVFLRPDGSYGMRFPILKKTYIGRGMPGDPEVDIPLSDDNVSRRHASISPKTGGLKLKDLNSTNGTFVQIQASVLLNDGDSFRLGEKVLRLVSYRGT
jgi:hypothetical protein